MLSVNLRDIGDTLGEILYRYVVTKLVLEIGSEATLPEFLL